MSESVPVPSATSTRSRLEQTWKTLSDGILTVATYGGFEPVSWYNPTESHLAQGRDIDFLRAFADTLDLHLDVRVFLFDRIWERPGRDEADIAAAGIAPLPERVTPGVAWTFPYYRVQRALLIRASEREQRRTISDLANGKIAVTRGSTADIDTVARRDPSTEVLYYDDQLRAVADVAAGVIDAFAEGDICAHYFAERNPLQWAVTDVHEMEPPETFSFAVRVTSGLLPLLNQYILSNREKY